MASQNEFDRESQKDSLPEKIVAVDLDATAAVVGHKIDADLAYEFALKNRSLTSEENVRVRRKIDRVVLPCFVILFCLQYLDKNALSYSAIWGLRTDLGLTHGQSFAWASNGFYFGYLATQPIMMVLIQRLPVGKVLGVAILCWAGILMCTPAVTGFAGMFINRFFLGMMEGVVQPGFVYITGMWYTKQEQPFRACIWYTGNGWGSIVGSLLGYAIGKGAHTALPKWALFFLIFGSITFCYAFVWLWFIPDNQLNARWLSDDQKHVAVERVRTNRTGIENRHWKWYQAREALISPVVWFCAFANLFSCSAASGPGTFGSIIVNGFGFSTLNTTVLSALPGGFFQIFTLLGCGWIATHFKNCRLLVASLSQLFGIIGSILLYKCGTTNKAGAMVGFVLTFGTTQSIAIYYMIVASSVAGATKKAVASMVIFIFYSAGQLSGPHFFITSQAPGYSLGFGMMMTCYALMFCLPLANIAYFVWENKRRDRLLAAKQAAGLEPKILNEEFLDLTDFEQIDHFRYGL